jgi:hypothetical protein
MAPRWIGPKKIPYTDGGVIDIAPLAQAIHLGATRIVAIVCQPEGTRPWLGNYHDVASLANRMLGIISDQILAADLDKAQLVNANLALANVAAVAGMSRTSASLQGQNAGKRIIELIVARPTKPVALDLQNFTHDQVLAGLDLGEDDMDRALDAHPL